MVDALTIASIGLKSAEVAQKLATQLQKKGRSVTVLQTMIVDLHELTSLENGEAAVQAAIPKRETVNTIKAGNVLVGYTVSPRLKDDLFFPDDFTGIVSDTDRPYERRLTSDVGDDESEAMNYGGLISGMTVWFFPRSLAPFPELMDVFLNLGKETTTALKNSEVIKVKNITTLVGIQTEPRLAQEISQNLIKELKDAKFPDLKFRAENVPGGNTLISVPVDDRAVMDAVVKAYEGRRWPF